jgi:hypothetical protein
VVSINPADNDVAGAIGSSERQALLTSADRARHDRQLKAAENSRAIKAYEAETALGLERERAQLIEQQATNRQKEAEADAAATAACLAPLAELGAGKIMGAALFEFAKSGHVDRVSVGPELLAALNQE